MGLTVTATTVTLNVLTIIVFMKNSTNLRKRITFLAIHLATDCRHVTLAGLCSVTQW